jgi:LytS/YehU family sensor histidine kinase
MLLGLFFGLIGSIILLLSRQIESEVKKRRLAQSESEKREFEANLKLLQAQIEPHFLFNTLANVGSLIDSDPALAKKLLERLNDWLRVALVRTRSHSATLGDELEMLENYLQILKIRFGDRLRWTIDVPENVRLLRFPPMLLQPLVENAVRHGIEPKIGGGEIGISSRFEDSIFHIEVSDTGVGLLGEEGSGSGLANIRARVDALFGTSGRLILQDKAGGGGCAVLEFPQ